MLLQQVPLAFEPARVSGIRIRRTTGKDDHIITVREVSETARNQPISDNQQRTLSTNRPITRRGRGLAA